MAEWETRVVRATSQGQVSARTSGALRAAGACANMRDGVTVLSRRGRRDPHGGMGHDAPRRLAMIKARWNRARNSLDENGKGWLDWYVDEAVQPAELAAALGVLAA